MYVITGATGNIGRVLTSLLLESGKKVKVISRNPEKVKALIEQGAEPIIGKQEDIDFLTRAFSGATAIFAMIPPGYNADNHLEYQKSKGTVLVKAIKNAGVKNVVALSSIGAHLPEKGGISNIFHNSGLISLSYVLWTCFCNK